MALNSTSAPAWVPARSHARLTMARVSASTSTGVFLIWYCMCTALVLMNVWMRGDAATLTASQQTRMSSSMARARPAMRGPLTSVAIALTASKSSGEAIGNPASMMSTRSLASWCAISSFSALFKVAPGACSPSRKRRVEDPDVPATAHESPTPPKACVVVRWSSGSGCDPRNGRAGRRCLRIPPRGEEEQAAEEGEVAGAYPNVGLPAGLACRTATHGPESLRHSCAEAQASGAGRRCSGQRWSCFAHPRRGTLERYGNGERPPHGTYDHTTYHRARR